MPVDVGPPRLNHPNLRIGEMMDGGEQKIRWRHEISIEDGDELTLRSLKPLRERPSFESFAVGAVVISDRKCLLRIVLDESPSHGHSFVRRIVEHLDIEPVQWILQTGD